MISTLGLAPFLPPPARNPTHPASPKAWTPEPTPSLAGPEGAPELSSASASGLVPRPGVTWLIQPICITERCWVPGSPPSAKPQRGIPFVLLLSLLVTRNGWSLINCALGASHAPSLPAWWASHQSGSKPVQGGDLGTLSQTLSS